MALPGLSNDFVAFPFPERGTVAIIREPCPSGTITSEQKHNLLTWYNVKATVRGRKNRGPGRELIVVGRTADLDHGYLAARRMIEFNGDSGGRASSEHQAEHRERQREISRIHRLDAEAAGIPTTWTWPEEVAIPAHDSWGTECFWQITNRHFYTPGDGPVWYHQHYSQSQRGRTFPNPPVRGDRAKGSGSRKRRAVGWWTGGWGGASSMPERPPRRLRRGIIQRASCRRANDRSAGAGLQVEMTGRSARRYMVWDWLFSAERLSCCLSFFFCGNGVVG